MALHATRRQFLAGVGLAGTAGTALLSPGRPAGSPTLATTVPAGTWPVPGRGPARTKHAPDAAPPTTDARVAWEASVPLSNWNLTVTTDGETVYAATPTGVVALDASDGTERWRFDTADYWPSGALEIRVGPLVAGDRVLLVTDAAVFGLDAAGSVAWARENVRGTARTAVLVGDALYLPDHQDGAELVAIDVATGGEWNRFDTEAFQSPVAFVADSLLSLDSDALARFDPRTGDRRWRTQVPVGIDVPATAVAGTADVAVVGSNPLTAVDTDDGSKRWQYEAPTGEDEVERFRPATDGERVYVSAYWAGETVAFDAGTGDVAWRVPERLGDPVVAGETVYCVDEDGVTALDAATGDRRGRLGAGLVPPDVGATLTVAGSRLYFGFESDEHTSQPTLFALEAP